MIKEETAYKIFNNDSGDWTGDNAYKGLQILAKYTDNLIRGASCSEIYSITIKELLKTDITKYDLRKLRKLAWMINDEGYLSCFV